MGWIKNYTGSHVYAPCVPLRGGLPGRAPCAHGRCAGHEGPREMSVVQRSDVNWRAPSGSVDCHIHLYDDRFAADPRAKLQPQGMTLERYRHVQEALGLERCVVVQPSTYGFDNACLLHHLDLLGSSARGVAVITEHTSQRELVRMHDLGVRAIRFSPAREVDTSIDSLEALARRIEPFGWHVQLNARGPFVAELAHRLLALPVPVVIDHMGRLPQPAGLTDSSWNDLRRLVDAGKTWIKLSGVYLDSREGPEFYSDTAAIAQAWIATAPERLLWGTDWPHPAALAGEMPVPDDVALFNMLGAWAPSDDLRWRILVENPCKLYGFPATARQIDQTDAAS
ncbi:amidohydrolase family protein [Rhizobium sp. P32RR-XVIII]|uniref:amidohydrolase family protein n=1 Tax=Rhizobium sp. P32RR-XVIII TaxID=2726738 RepID=UPI0028AD100A|nr:amidohydrolase family protein [Rhizobium sp. P32RR-XVIII]